MLDLRRLRLLRELEARGTIAAVAESLSYTPSAVSQQLAQLERETGVKLLERVGRRVRLTDPARLLVSRTEELLALMEQAEAELAGATGEVRGTVRLASFQTAALALLPRALGVLAGAHPDLRVEYVESEAEESLPLIQLGELDLAIAEEYEHAPRARLSGVTFEELCRDRILLALPESHPLALGGGPVSLAQLRDATWASSTAETAFAYMETRACRLIGGFEPRIRHRANDVRILLTLVAAAQAVAFVPGLGEPESAPGVAVRPVAEQELSRSIFTAVRGAAADRPAIKALRWALQESWASHPRAAAPSSPTWRPASP